MWKLMRLMAVLAASSIAIAGCYTAETAILTAENSLPLEGVGGGVYCHAENRLVPPQVSLTPQISEALGNNKCRALHWDPQRGQYVDENSSSMIFRTAPGATGPLSILQVQTGSEAAARYMPVAAVDGLFVVYDPAGEWPEERLAGSGLSLNDEGVLLEAGPDAVRALLDAIWPDILQRMRTDIAFVEDAAGARLEFRTVDAAYSYLVHFRDDLPASPDRFRAAMLSLAESLGLGRYDATWTDHAE
jgi:hypothetical protein